MPESDSARGLLKRWQSGDEAAAAAIYQLYWERLCALTRSRIGKRLRRRVDPDDIVQSVFRSFFRRARDGDFTLSHSDSLWRLLVGITRKKIGRQNRQHHAARRSVEAEVEQGEIELSPEALAHNPTPLEAAALTEALEATMAELDASKREILTLCLRGYSCSEIGGQVGYSRWTVRRVLDRVGHRLQERFDSGK